MKLTPLLLHFVETGFKVAESQIREGKEVIPQLTLLAQDQDGTVIVPVMITAGDLGPKNGSRFAKMLVRYAWEKILSERPLLKLLAISVMADTWIEIVSTLEYEKQVADGSFVPPSQKPGSTEVIFVQLTLPDGDRLYELPYVRAGKEVVFSDKPKERENPKAIYMGLWPL